MKITDTDRKNVAVLRGKLRSVCLYLDEPSLGSDPKALAGCTNSALSALGVLAVLERTAGSELAVKTTALLRFQLSELHRWLERLFDKQHGRQNAVAVDSAGLYDACRTYRPHLTELRRDLAAAYGFAEDDFDLDVDTNTAH